MLYIFDRNENLLKILSNDDIDTVVYSDNYKRQINGEWSYTFSIDINKISNQFIQPKNKVGFFDENGNFQLFSTENIEDDITDDSIKNTYCLHDFYSLTGHIIEDKRVINGTALEATTKALEGTNYKVGNIAELGNNSINFYDVSSLAALQDIIKTFGGELNFRLELNENKTAIANRYVDILYRHGSDTGIRFDFDLNLNEVKRKIDTTNLFTVLYGRGSALESGDGYGRKIRFSDINNGNSYIEDVEAINKWGRIEGIFNYETEDTSELLQATSKKLEEVKEPFISYSANVTDLASVVDYEHLKVTLGDTIVISDTDIDLILEARIIEENLSVIDPGEKDVVLGNFLKGFAQNQASQIENIQNKADKLEEKPKVFDKSYPDTLPEVPILTANGLFASVQLEWTYENKPHFEYEIFASKILDFTPDESNLIYRGQASSFLHYVKPKETWYYRARGRNSRGSVTEYSSQVNATTLKIQDGTEYIEELAIGDALLGSLKADRAWVGQFKGEDINAKNLTVVDGNDNETLKVDSYGNVYISQGSVSINKEGITITQQEGESVSGTANINEEGLILYNSNGQQRASFGQNDFAYIKDLQVETIEAPRLVTKRDRTQPISWYVSPTATGDGTGRDINNKCNSINRALENAFATGTVLDRQDIVINVASGTYNENIYIGSCIGTGMIKFNFDKNSKIVGVHTIEENVNFIMWDGGRTSNTLNEGCQLINNGSSNDLINNRSSNLHLTGFRVDNKNKTSFVLNRFSGNCYLNMIDLVNSYYATRSWSNSRTTYNNCRGSNITNMGHVTEGSELKVQGAMFNAVESAYVQNGGQYTSLGHYGIESLYSPPPITWEWVENSFSLSNYRSTQGSSTKYGEFNQANWGSYTDYHGYADIPSSLRSWCSGGRNFTVWVTVKRKTTSHGYADPVPRPHFKRPDGSYWNSGVAMARGDSKTIQLPSDIANAIVNGSMTVLECYHTSQNEYIQFETNVSIKVKCEKEV